MLTFAPTMRSRTRVATMFNRLRTTKLQQFSTFNFRELYCFGITDQRRADVYISPQIPNSPRLAEILCERFNIETLCRTIGNAAPRHWIALSSEFRLNNPTSCAKVLLLTCLALNHRINFETN